VSSVADPEEYFLPKNFLFGSDSRGQKSTGTQLRIRSTVTFLFLFNLDIELLLD
jgi:hypothetical protein